LKTVCNLRKLTMWGEKEKHALFKKQKTPRAGTDRSKARNTLSVIKSIRGLYQETEKAC
jgi:hypothetical protein